MHDNNKIGELTQNVHPVPHFREKKTRKPVKICNLLRRRRIQTQTMKRLRPNWSSVAIPTMIKIILFPR
jgi:hypothetical protein